MIVMIFNLHMVRHAKAAEVLKHIYEVLVLIILIGHVFITILLRLY